LREPASPKFWKSPILLWTWAWLSSALLLTRAAYQPIWSQIQKAASPPANLAARWSMFRDEWPWHARSSNGVEPGIGGPWAARVGFG